MSTLAEDIASDPRIVYGARCTWWDSIAHVAQTRTGLPICPYCGSPLFETESLDVWLEGARAHEADGHPGYLEFVLWLRGRGCFVGEGRLDRARAAHAAELELAERYAQVRAQEDLERGPLLGLATTRELMLELIARLDHGIDVTSYMAPGTARLVNRLRTDVRNLDDEVLDYRTVAP